MKSAVKALSAKERQILLQRARKAMKQAHAPYSNFRVGAALLTTKGKVFAGCNVENASYGMERCPDPLSNVGPSFFAHDFGNLAPDRETAKIGKRKRSWTRNHSVYGKSPVSKTVVLEAFEFIV